MAKDSSGTATAELCAKCGVRPRGDSHKWCRECKAEAQKGYDADRERMLEIRGFDSGAKAFRAVLLASMLGPGFHPEGFVKLSEVTNFISRMPVPVFTPAS